MPLQESIPADCQGSNTGAAHDDRSQVYVQFGPRKVARHSILGDGLAVYCLPQACRRIALLCFTVAASTHTVLQGSRHRRRLAACKALWVLTCNVRHL